MYEMRGKRNLLRVAILQIAGHLGAAHDPRDREQQGLRFGCPAQRVSDFEVDITFCINAIPVQIISSDNSTSKEA